MRIDADLFLNKYQTATHVLEGSALVGLRIFLGFIQNDLEMTDKRWISYVLATTRHECAGKWLPIEEFGKGVGKDYGWPINGKSYYGRGYVQLTWLNNYQTMGNHIGVDLANNPDLALVPDIAYRIMSYGMVKGSFTGVGLSRFINASGCDYFNARKIVNSLDQATTIKAYAELFESLL